MRYEVIYSADDGGWYAEVYDSVTGKTIHTTAVFATRYQAIKEVKDWVKQYAARK